MANQPPQNKTLKATLSARDLAENADSKSVSEILEALQVRKMLKEALDEERLEEQRKTASARQMLEIEKEIQEREAIQEACTHRKENGRPAIGGQRDSSQNVRLMCLFCQREWTNFGSDGSDPTKLPPHLHIPMEKIGGY